MIRRIQITNDLLDVIKSCPSGVIDDIYKIEYYIQGFDTVYDAEFTHEGDSLKVVLPSSELEKLESGILMRRAYYKVSDSSYPDGYYNLTFEDNMNVWLGGESSDPYERQYVTDKELNETLEDYALKTEVPSLDGYATQEWVDSKGYLTSTGMSGLATQSWVSSNFLSTTALNGYATQSWVLSNFLSTTALNGYATESWVNNQGYITSIPDTFATKYWVSTQGYLTEHQSLDGYATQSWVSSQQFATQSWVSSNFLSTTALSGYATQSWATSQFLEESKIWTGTQSAWDALTPTQQASYTIALITE